MQFCVALSPDTRRISLECGPALHSAQIRAVSRSNAPLRCTQPRYGPYLARMRPCVALSGDTRRISLECAPALHSTEIRARISLECGPVFGAFSLPARPTRPPSEPIGVRQDDRLSPKKKNG